MEYNNFLDLKVFDFYFVGTESYANDFLISWKTASKNFIRLEEVNIELL